MSLAEGQVTVFAAAAHCTAECVGIHAVKRAARFEALEPLRQNVRKRIGALGQKAGAGLRICHFRNLKVLQTALRTFREQYNREWLIERLGFQPRRQVRERFLALQQAA